MREVWILTKDEMKQFGKEASQDNSVWLGCTRDNDADSDKTRMVYLGIDWTLHWDKNKDCTVWLSNVAMRLPVAGLGSWIKMRGALRGEEGKVRVEVSTPAQVYENKMDESIADLIACFNKKVNMINWDSYRWNIELEINVELNCKIIDRFKQLVRSAGWVISDDEKVKMEGHQPILCVCVYPTLTLQKMGFFRVDATDRKIVLTENGIAVQDRDKQGWTIYE